MAAPTSEPGCPTFRRYAFSAGQYIVYRSRDDVVLGSHRPRRGWDRIGG
jgi:hypothetical protein